MIMQNNFGKFEYFINGVVSSLKQAQWENQMASSSKKSTSKKVQIRPVRRVRDGFHTEDMVYLRSQQDEVLRFWKGKQDYVHTG